MGLVETEGLILKNYSLSDADKIVVFLSKTHGLVRGVAKGAKKLKSNFGSSLEPFSIVKISYFQKEQQELVSVRGSELLKSFFGTASDPAALQRFAYMADLVSEFAPPSEPNERMFNMMRVCLEACVAKSEGADAVIMYFELWLLKLGGYLPSWEHCAECGKTADNAEMFLQDSYRLFCAHCHQGSKAVGVSTREQELFASAQRMSPEKFIEFSKESNNAVRAVSSILRRIIAGILGRDWQESRILTSIY